MVTLSINYQAAKGDLFHLCKKTEPLSPHDLGAVDLMLEAYPGLVNERDDRNDLTLLHLAASHGHAALCEKLIAAGADIDARNQEGATPFYQAVVEGKGNIARLLCEHGADIDQPDNEDLTPLRIAQSFAEDPSLLRLLLCLGAGPKKFLQADETSAPRRMRALKEEVSGHFSASPPRREQCFSPDTKLNDVVLLACATGDFGRLVAAPLIASQNPADRQLFKDIWDALSKRWQNRHQNLSVAFQKAGGTQPVLGAHTAEARTPRSPETRAL